MPAPEVRPFRRTDRDQLTDLVNMHVAAVAPSVSVSVNTVLGDLERQPGEFITDPRVADLPAPEPRPGVTAERTLGECGTRFTARSEGKALGFVEIDTALARPERHARAAGLADIGNLHIDPAQHGTGLEHWLLARAADWLRLCGVDRLVAYESAADSAMTALLNGAGFRELTCTERGWVHRPGRPQMPGR